jgi:HD-like signal output (HDOD) protein
MPAAPQMPDATPVNPEAVFRGLVQDLTKGELELPGFPDVVLRLQRALADPKTAAKDILKLIQSEPALAGRLMQLANSVAFNKSGREVSDLRSAITSLGFNLIRAQANSFAMKQMEQQQWLLPIREQLAEIWGWSNGTAALANSIAQHVEGVQADEALAVGLFHQLGKLYLYSRALRAGVPPAQIQGWENEINDWHPPIAKAILDHWGMPERMGDAVENQNALFETEAQQLPPLSRLLAAAKLCYRRSSRMARGEQDSEASQILARIKINGKPLLGLLEQMGGEIETMRIAISF